MKVILSSFFCSVIIPPYRFVSRELVNAPDFIQAYLKTSLKYQRITQRYEDTIYLIEQGDKYWYFDIDCNLLDTNVL